jgi:hypothetical protein
MTKLPLDLKTIMEEGLHASYLEWWEDVMAAKLPPETDERILNVLRLVSEAAWLQGYYEATKTITGHSVDD